MISFILALMFDVWESAFAFTFAFAYTGRCFSFSYGTHLLVGYLSNFFDTPPPPLFFWMDAIFR
jgi:hypothetical protein